MSKPIPIACELTITPGGSTQQNRVALRANGETVFDEYEESLDDGQRKIVAAIAAAESRLLGKFSQKLEGR